MEIQFATFSIGSVKFAVDILSIKEFYKKIDYSIVNRSPEFVRGLLNLRGQIITLVDLKKMFFGENQEFSKNTRCIILKSKTDVRGSLIPCEVELENPSDRIGLLVESIGEMLTVKEEQLEDCPANLSFIEREFVKSVFETEDGLFVVLEFKSIFKDFAVNA